jgi:hypothetical protein
VLLVLVQGLTTFVNHFARLVISHSFTIPIAKTDTLNELLYDYKCASFSALRHGPHKKSVKPSLLPSKVWFSRFPLDRYCLILADT